MSRELTGLLKAYHKTGVNAIATLTLTGVAGSRWKLKRINFSYDAAPTGGALTVTSSGTTDASGTAAPTLDGVLDAYAISSAGPGFMSWGDEWVECGLGATVVIALAAGGSGITGQFSAVAKLVDGSYPIAGV